MQIDKKLIDKYNIPVPRYTSYPPANHFSNELNETDAVKLISSSNNWEPGKIALYVHIPFCKKICFYCGCNACTVRSKDEVTRYLEALRKEIRIVAGLIDKKRPVTQLHFGGGTPNSLPYSKLSDIVDEFNTQFSFSEDAEIAIETNPAYLDREYLDALVGAGFNRFSFGIQDLKPEVLKNVNRDPSRLPLHELTDHLRNKKEKIAINLDFIYGLPGQTVNSFSETMREAVQLNPDRLVTFSYAHVPWVKKHQKILEKKGLPGPYEKAAMFSSAGEILEQWGYMPVGLDHFVKQEDELYKALDAKMLHRNFQGYCTRETTGQVYAFGVSAISQLQKAYIQNTKSIPEYVDSLSRNKLPVAGGTEITTEQEIIREAINTLMCNLVLDLEKNAEKAERKIAGIKEILQYDPESFSEMESDGLVEAGDTIIKVTGKGAPFVRNAAAHLDPLLKVTEKKYSKSV